MKYPAPWTSTVRPIINRGAIEFPLSRKPISSSGSYEGNNRIRSALATEASGGRGVTRTLFKDRETNTSLLDLLSKSADEARLSLDVVLILGP